MRKYFKYATRWKFSFSAAYNDIIRWWRWLIKRRETFHEVGQLSKYKLRKTDRSSNSIIQLVGQLGSVRHFKLPPTSSSESKCTFHFKLRNCFRIRITIDYWFWLTLRTENIKGNTKYSNGFFVFKCLIQHFKQGQKFKKQIFKTFEIYVHFSIN